MQEAQEEVYEPQQVPMQVEDPTRFNVRQLDVDFQKHILDVTHLKDGLKAMWCGHRYDKKTIKVKSLGKTRIKFVTTFRISKAARIMNEDCADWIADSMWPMIYAAASTSTMDKVQIWYQITGKIHAICETLDASVKDGNPYEFKIERLPDVSTFLASMLATLNKAQGGFTLLKMVESIYTSYSTSANTGGTQIQPMKPPGLLQRLTGGNR